MTASNGDSGPGPVPVTLDEVRTLVGRQLGVERVRAEDHLIEDLGAESADVLNLVVTLEDRYRIRIEEEEVPELATVADFYELVRRRAR